MKYIILVILFFPLFLSGQFYAPYVKHYGLWCLGEGCPDYNVTQSELLLSRHSKDDFGARLFLWNRYTSQFAHYTDIGFKLDTVFNSIPSVRIRAANIAGTYRSELLFSTSDTVALLRDRFKVKYNGDLQAYKYPNSRNDPGDPINVLTTDNLGNIQSHPIGELPSGGGGGGDCLACCDSLFYHPNDTAALLQGWVDSSEYYLLSTDNTYGWAWGTLKQQMVDSPSYWLITEIPTDAADGYVLGYEDRVGFKGKGFAECKLKFPDQYLYQYVSDDEAYYTGGIALGKYYRLKNDNVYGMPENWIKKLNNP